MAESKEELKSLLMRVKEESEKAGSKLITQKTNVMASGPITLWLIDRKKWKQTDFIFFGSKITVDGDCSHEIKTIAPLKESYEKLPRQLKYHFANKGPHSQSCGFHSSHVQICDLDHK